MADDFENNQELELELSPTRIVMFPGGAPVDVTVVVRNGSRVVEQSTIEVVGLDPDWFTHPTRSLALFPGDSDQLRIAFHVPDQAALRVGTYPFTVIATSRSSGVERRVDGQLVVLGEPAYAMDIAPRRLVVGREGLFRVLLTNSGTADGELQLGATDAEEGVAFQFPKDQRPRVPANSVVEVPLRAVPRHRPWVGPERTYTFQVTARRPESLAQVLSVGGQLIYRPRFASLSFLRRLALLVGVVAALLVVVTALPAELRCRLVGQNGALPLLGRGCGVGEIALTTGAVATGTQAAATSTAAPAPKPAVVAAGGGGGGAPSPVPPADQQAADAMGGGGGAGGGGMTAEGVPTPVPPAATAAAVFMAGVDATQVAAATAVATATLRPTPAPTNAALAATAIVTLPPTITSTATTRVVAAASFQAGACSAAQQPPPTAVPTRGPAVKPSAVPKPAPTRIANEWSQSDPTAWWYCFGVTTDQLAQFLKSNQVRLIDIGVEQAQPTPLLSAVAVSNQGAYARDWWWYFGLDDVQVQERFTTNNARPIALRAYDAAGKTRFAVVMVANKAPDTKTFWWFPDLAKAQQIDHLLTTNKARLVDVDPYIEQGQRRYAVVMIANTGADQANSWWYDNVSTDQITAEVNRTGGHVIDIEPNDVGAGTFDVILEACPCARNWWAVGLDAAGLTSTLEQTHGRMISLASYVAAGQRRFAVALIDNT